MKGHAGMSKPKKHRNQVVYSNKISLTTIPHPHNRTLQEPIRRYGLLYTPYISIAKHKEAINTVQL